MNKKYHHMIRLSSLVMMGAVLSISSANAADEEEEGAASCNENFNYYCKVDEEGRSCAHYPVCSEPPVNTLTGCNDGLKKDGWYTGAKVLTFVCQV